MPDTEALAGGEIYRKSLAQLDGDAQGKLLFDQYMNSSTAIYHGAVTGYGYLPKIYDAATLARFAQIATTTADILDKVSERFILDASYRELFGFSELLERLICLPAGYKQMIPIMRVDIFYDEDTSDFKFCEFNTDGSSAMNEDREIANAMAQTATFALSSKSIRLSAQELFDPWVECFLANWIQWREERGLSQSQTPTKTLSPVVAIVDYRQSATMHELEEFRLRFMAYGCECMICDMGDLRLEDGVLYGIDVNPNSPFAGKQTCINAVYRRAVTSEIVSDLISQPAKMQSLASGEAKATEVLTGAVALSAAVAGQSICMQGSYRTQVAHSKAIFRMLHHPKTLEFLSPNERDFITRHVPFTVSLKPDSEHLSDVLNNKNDWIIKPVDGYASAGVHAGRGYDQNQWQELVKQCLEKNYIAQQYCRQYSMLNISSKDGDSLLKPYNVLTGLFIYNGKLSGVYTRAGANPLIVGFQGGITLATLLANYNPSCANQMNCMIRERKLSDYRRDK